MLEVSVKVRVISLVRLPWMLVVLLRPINLSINLKVGHRLCNLVHARAHCFVILALRVIIVVIHILILPIFFKAYFLTDLLLIDISLISDLPNHILVDVIIILVLYLRIFLIYGGEF